MFLNIPMPQQRLGNERTAQAIDDGIRKLLADAHARVAQPLQGNRDGLETLAKLLSEKNRRSRSTG